MINRRMLLGLVPAGVLGVGLAGTAGWMATHGDPASTGIGGPFRLTAGDGRTVTDADFRGRWMLVYFGYTNCPDDCPLTLQKMSTPPRKSSDRSPTGSCRCSSPSIRCATRPPASQAISRTSTRVPSTSPEATSKSPERRRPTRCSTRRHSTRHRGRPREPLEFTLSHDAGRHVQRALLDRRRRRKACCRVAGETHLSIIVGRQLTDRDT